MANCWYCNNEIKGFRYKIGDNDSDIECANKEINRVMDILGRIMAEVDQFVGFGLGYDKPEFYWYIFVETEQTMHIVRNTCAEAEVGFSLYPLLTPMTYSEVPEPIVALPDRIVLGGVSIGHLLAKTVGTLGGIIRAGNQKYAVSTAEIIAPEGAQLGDAIVQPSIADSPKKVYSLGKLSVISKLGFGSLNDLDAAIATVDSELPTTPRIKEIGRPNEVSDPELGVAVRKTGRSTGFTEGKIFSTDVRIKVRREDKLYTMQDQFIVMADAGEFAKRGDEGAFIFDNNNDFIGMIQFAFHGMAVCSRAGVLMERFGFMPPYCFEPAEEDF